MLDIDIRARVGDFNLDASLQLESAGVTALFGPSGSGKTMLVNAVAVATLIGIAYLLGWLKSEPWRSKKPRAAEPQAADAPKSTAVPSGQPAE